MYAEISGALASLKTITELVKAAGSMSNYGEMLAAVNTVQEKLSQALVANLTSAEKQAALLERVRELEEQAVKFKDWETKSKDYVLQAVGVEQRHFAQVYKPAVQPAQARHWACTKCFEERKLYVLNAHGLLHYKCPNCGTEITPIIRGGSPAPIDSAYE
jgi:rubrerythrin